MKYFFPCSNGCGCVGDGRFSVALITREGNKQVQSCPSKNKVIFHNFLFLRGLEYFIFGLVAIFACFNASYSLSGGEKSKTSKNISKIFLISARYFFLLICLAVSFFVAYFLFGFFPAKLSFLLLGNSPNMFLRSFVISIFKILFLFCLLLIFRLLPSMQYFYKFNGGINIMQSDGKSVHKALNFVNFLVFSLFLSVFVISLVSVNIGVWANLGINILLLCACISLSYEILLALQGSKLEKLCAITSWFVAISPSITAEEIAKVAKLESEINGKSLDKICVSGGQIAMSALITEMQSKLASTNCEKSDIDWIIATVLGCNRSEIRLIKQVSSKDYHDIMSACDRRSRGEPLSSIFGFVDFYGLKFDVNKKVLSPRPETELLVEEAIKQIKANSYSTACDLCTGSGAIAITLSKLTNAKVTAIDISKSALATAKANCQKLGGKVNFVESDLFCSLKKSKKFDIIVCNPPYIPSGDIEKLDDEVKKYDPLIALDGGDDGLDFYRKIIQIAPSRLNKNGTLMFEIGINQAKEVKKMLKNAKFIDTRVLKDYNKIERIVYGKYCR